MSYGLNIAFGTAFKYFALQIRNISTLWNSCELCKYHVHGNIIYFRGNAGDTSKRGNISGQDVSRPLRHIRVSSVHLRADSPAEGWVCTSGSWFRWARASAAAPRRWPGSCCCRTRWWAGGEGDACCAQTPQGGSGPCLPGRNQRGWSRHILIWHCPTAWIRSVFTAKEQITTQLVWWKIWILIFLTVHIPCWSNVNSPKNKACSSKGKCMIQSSLTLWSTTISVIKITAILHL